MLERDLADHLGAHSGQSECWRDSETPGTALSGKGPCVLVGLLKPKVKTQTLVPLRMLMLSPYKPRYM